MNCVEPLMTPAERDMLGSLVQCGYKVLEFGSGGSTGFFFEKGAWSVTSVESDRRWLVELGNDPFLRHFYKAGRWVGLHTDIGATAEWGMPKKPAPSLGWLNYHQHVWEFLPYKDPDLVLIDGRFRVACLCQTLLNCTGADPVIFMHDFWSRPEYHVALELASLQERADDAAVLRRRPDTDWRLLCATLLRHQFDPS